MSGENVIRDFTITELSRFTKKFVARPAQCWEWKAARTTAGYGHMYLGKRGKANAYAHRLSYILVKGPIPDELQLDHLCRNPGCINPQHLEAVTQQENFRRGNGVWAGGAAGRAKTHCVKGHQYTTANTYFYPNGRSRACRTCVRTRSLAAYYRRKAKKQAHHE